MYNVVLLGCGMMAKTWASYVAHRPDTRMVALVDVAIASAEAFNQEFDFGARVYTDYIQAFSENEIDIVLNTTPPQFHFEIGMAALKRGFHVFSEKPMADTLEQCLELAAEAESSDRVFAIMQNRRYLGSIRSCAEMVGSGLIGKIGFVCADYFMGRAGMGRHYGKLESPLLYDMAIHTFDEARLLTGKNAISVQAYEFNHPGTDFSGKESAVCLFEMEDGSVFSYRGCWCAPGANTPSQGSWRITGDGGTILWDGEHYPVADLRGDVKDTYISVSERVEGKEVYRGRETYDGCLDAMFDALDRHTLPETVYSDNIHSMKMVFAAIESARTGKKVRL